MTLTVSLGQHRADASPTRFSCTFEQLVAFLKARAPTTGEKDGQYLVFADFGTEPRAPNNTIGTRDYEHLEASYAIPLDLDLGKYVWSAADIAARLAGYQFVAWTSYSHTLAAPRWRVVVVTERSMTADEHRGTWQTLAARFADDCGKGSCDATRLNYLPGACLHPELAQLISGDGKGFPVSTVPTGTLEETGSEWRDKPVEGYDGTTDDDELIAHMLAARSKAQDAFAPPGTPTRFEALWYADAEHLAKRFPPSETGQEFDHTKADAAIANELVFFTGGDCERALRIMERGALAQRYSWEERKGRRAIELALKGRKPDQYAFLRSVPAEPEATPLAAGILAVPKAQHLTTDQANAERLQRHYGNNLISCAGEFLAWDGARWKRDDALPQRFACELSVIVRAEADKMRTEAAAAQAAVSPAEIAASLANPRLKPLRAGETGSKAYDLTQIAEALDAWSRKCEMKSTQDAALGLLKKLLSVDADALDADPWLLNVRNGTLDLRTGTLNAHDPANFITKLAPVEYDPAAKAPRFATFLQEIFNEDASLVAFLARWFGYASTGSVREQKLVIHWGTGSNGKSTLLELVEAVLGDYATAAPPGLIATKDNDGAQPSEIAELHARRLVTASESEDGARMREAFIKVVTGGDRLKGRRPYGQWFAFSPTHKLQLLTNHKPQIRGSDYAIWRRILLVPYTQSYGTPEDVAAGKAKLLGDPTLKQVLSGELPGVLAWLVEGARRWYADGGLKAPDVVLAAGAEYQTEQDRLREYVSDRCRLDLGAWSLVGVLYRDYQTWCHETGVHPLGRGRFTTELERVVPAFRRQKRDAGHGVVGIVLASAFGRAAQPAATASA